MKPLCGITILDLSRVYAAPAGTMLLGDLGAEVIRVEHPNGSDNMRDWGPFINGVSTYYLCANRNKKSIGLDLKNEMDKQQLLSLIESSDVIIDNFKTGDMEKLGLNYAELVKINPKIIQCSVTGFGQTGPLAKEPGYDPVIQAMSGLMDVTGAPNGEAMKVGIPIADILTSNYVAIGILAALRMRDRTGVGQFIDLSLLDVQISSLANVTSAYLNTNYESKRLGNQHNNVTPYQVFQCSDGPIMICVGNDYQFEKFCKMTGQLQWLEEEKYKTNTLRKMNEQELVNNIGTIIITRTCNEWIELLREYKIPGGKVNTVSQALNDPQVIARDMVGEIEHPTYGKVKFIKNPLRFSGLNITYDLSPPLLGEHTEQILSQQIETT